MRSQKRERKGGGARQCREETERARGARDQARAEAAEAAAEGVPGKGRGVVLQPGLVVIVFAPTAVRDRPINWGSPVMTNDAPSAERR